MLRILISLGLLAAAAPAAADVTGHYRVGASPETLTIEVNEAGIVRFGADGADVYTLLDGTDGFAVTTEAGVTEVVRLSDLKAVVEDEFRQMLGSVPETPAQAPGEPWQTIGPASVHGRTGVEYRPPNETLHEGERIVLSDDAQLAPLGLAWSRAFDLMPSFGGMLGPAATPNIQRLREMLQTKAPLQLGGILLVSASQDEIEPDRFVLPAAPLTREQVAAMMERRRRQAEPEGGQ